MLNSPTSAAYCKLFFFWIHLQYVTTSDFSKYMVPTDHFLVQIPGRPTSAAAIILPIAWPARSPVLTPLEYFLWSHMNSFIYKIPVESERPAGTGYGFGRMLEYQVLLIVCTRTLYVGTVYVLKSLVATLLVKWSQKINCTISSKIGRVQRVMQWNLVCNREAVCFRT